MSTQTSSLHEFETFAAFGRGAVFRSCESGPPANPLIPPWCPHLPAPGADFLLEADRRSEGQEQPTWEDRKRGDAELAYLVWRAIYGDALRPFNLQVEHKGRSVGLPHLPGGPLLRVGIESGVRLDFEQTAQGPYPARVMLVGKQPNRGDFMGFSNLFGHSASELRNVLADLNVSEEETASWYVTNLVKHDRADAAESALASRWIKNGLHLLWQEILLVQPELVICMGGEAIKAFLGKSAKVDNTHGKVQEFTCRVPDFSRPDLDLEDFDSYREHTFRVVTTISPAAVAVEPDNRTALYKGMSNALAVSRGWRTSDREEDLDHAYLRTPEDVTVEVNKLLAYGVKHGGLRLAIDAEWHGRNWDEPGAYLRTIQFSHRPKYARGIAFRTERGTPTFTPEGEKRVIRDLRRLFDGFKGCPVRIGGHYFKADIPWIRRFTGIDLAPKFEPPHQARPGDPAWERTKTEGGFDTAYMAHAVFESAEFKLENLAAILVGTPMYNAELEAWKTTYCRELGISKKDLEGYGPCPSEILEPYSLYDVCSTSRLAWLLDGEPGKPGLLDCDAYGLNSRKAFWILQQAAPALLEMEITGLAVDLERVAALTTQYNAAKEKLEVELNRRIAASGAAWPDFNPNSAFHVRELLFGTELNGKKGPDGLPLRLRPEGVASLGLSPVKTTGKRAQAWDKVVARGEEALFTPGTDKESLGILLHTAGDPARRGVVSALRDFRFMSQATKTTLRLPARNKDGTLIRKKRIADVIYRDDGVERIFAKDDDGEDVEDDFFDKGILQHLHFDNRLRSRFYLAETGRTTSSAPNLQNFSKRREDDVKRVLGYLDDKGRPRGDYLEAMGGATYQFPARSVIRNDDGHVLLEFDLQVAEVAALAWLASDQAMMEDVRRSMLPDDHPDKLDIHCKTAVQAFRLDCEPTKKALEKIGKPGLRVAAKNVRFGVPYGRGALAISRQCLEEGTIVSVDECQRLIDGFHAMYPSASMFLREAEWRPAQPGWICGVYGRYRRFPKTSDPKVFADQQRAAKNFKIQNAVADYVWLLCWELMRWRREHKDPGAYKIALQIHDALVLSVPDARVQDVISSVLPECFGRVPLYPNDFDGNPIPGIGPYFFGYDVELFRNWGEKIRDQERQVLNVA